MMSQCPPPSSVGVQGSQSSTQSYRIRTELVKTRISCLSSHVVTGQGRPNSHKGRGSPALFQADLPCLPPPSPRAFSAGSERRGFPQDSGAQDGPGTVVPRECSSSSGMWQFLGSTSPPGVQGQTCCRCVAHGAKSRKARETRRVWCSLDVVVGDTGIHLGDGAGSG